MEINIITDQEQEQEQEQEQHQQQEGCISTLSSE
jgi:hypothetical protein